MIKRMRKKGGKEKNNDRKIEGKGKKGKEEIRWKEIDKKKGRMKCEVLRIG